MNKKHQGFTFTRSDGGYRYFRILASMVVPNLMGNKDKADQQKAVSDIVALENAFRYVQVR